MDDELKKVEQRFGSLSWALDERTRRLFGAAEAKALGYGGVTAVSKATGISRRALTQGCRELASQSSPKGRGHGWRRRSGGGRKSITSKDAELVSALEALIEPTTRGDPESPLRWTCMSLRQLANALCAKGHAISHRMVGELLKRLDYSLQGNRKTLEGGTHVDRDAQFHFIHDQVQQYRSNGQPVISVDTKKKELIGNYKNAGKQWRAQGHPEEVKVHDFIDPQLGRANPYGVYDVASNEGWVSVGTDHDTASFAVESIRRWWGAMGRGLYPQARELLITADGGGSNGSRVRLWKTELQTLANEMNLAIRVCHLPPGTSKWNKIEHRLFSYISMNWRGKPLVSHEVIVNLIAATTTKTGLRVKAALDPSSYPAGVKVSDAELAAVNIARDPFHGEWNYVIRPKTAG
jgi:hypothetical protein